MRISRLRGSGSGLKSVSFLRTLAWCLDEGVQLNGVVQLIANVSAVENSPPAGPDAGVAAKTREYNWLAPDDCAGGQTCTGAGAADCRNGAPQGVVGQVHRAVAIAIGAEPSGTGGALRFPPDDIIGGIDKAVVTVTPQAATSLQKYVDPANSGCKTS